MTTRTPERETWFHWIGPISQADWVLFGRADRHFEIRTLDDARGLRIGAYNGDVRGEFLKARGLNVEFAQNDDSNPKKLMLDRIDLWVNSTRSSRAVLARTGLTGKVVPVHTYQLVKLYLACNAAMPVVDIARMNGAARDGGRRQLQGDRAALRTFADGAAARALSRAPRKLAVRRAVRYPYCMKTLLYIAVILALA
ncbi:transporter substrate-binding domain-containing protein [Massilia sp. H-1]|nr:transporter substrate-binding domain-containing protein [Massilia sp. H-1]